MKEILKKSLLKYKQDFINGEIEELSDNILSDYKNSISKNITKIDRIFELDEDTIKSLEPKIKNYYGYIKNSFKCKDDILKTLTFVYFYCSFLEDEIYELTGKRYHRDKKFQNYLKGLLEKL